MSGAFTSAPSLAGSRLVNCVDTSSDLTRDVSRRLTLGFGTQNDPKSLSDDAEAGCLPKRSMHPGKQEYELES